MSALLKLVPLPYRILALALFAAALVGFGWVKGISHEQSKQQAAQLAQQTAVNKAVFDKLASNQKVIAQQQQTNQLITESKNDELTKVRADLNAERLRVGGAFCSGAIVDAAAESAGGSNDANTTGRILSAGVDEAVKSLIIESESVAATGRACQAFVTKNGLVP